MKKLLYIFKCFIVYYFTFYSLSSALKIAVKNPLTTSRIKALESRNINEVVAMALTNCTQAYYYGEILRGYENDFLLRFRQEGETLMSQVQEGLQGLGVSDKEISDLQYLQEVTIDEIDRMVSINVDFLDDYLHTCKRTCQNLHKATSYELEEAIKSIKLLASDVKIKIFTSAKDMSSIFLEFYEFVQAMMMDSELHEVIYAIEDLFEEFYDMLAKQKTTIIIGRKKFILGKINLINRLGDLAYKLKAIQK